MGPSRAVSTCTSLNPRAEPGGGDLQHFLRNNRRGNTVSQLGEQTPHPQPCAQTQSASVSTSGSQSSEKTPIKPRSATRWKPQAGEEHRPQPPATRLTQMVMVEAKEVAAEKASAVTAMCQPMKSSRRCFESTLCVHLEECDTKVGRHVGGAGTC